jgi:hypothetical protein
VTSDPPDPLVVFTTAHVNNMILCSHGLKVVVILHKASICLEKFPVFLPVDIAFLVIGTLLLVCL